MSDLEAIEILLVEDSDADAEMTMRALKKGNVTNNVVWVKDGVEALEFIHCTGAYSERQRRHPKLILLDIKMPRMDGIAVLKRLKSDESTRPIPIVILTSSAEERDVVESYRLGVNSYLVKPVDFGEFVEVVAHAGLFWALMNKVPS
jgi:two-component system, response regulator